MLTINDGVTVMRITAEEKQATRLRIVEAAVELFQAQGFDTTTTRDIARQAGIATGTLFNYFETKEALVAELAAEALDKGRTNFARQELIGELEEWIFALVAAELRQLKSHRRYISPLLETVLSPLVLPKQSGVTESFRVDHLALIAGLIQRAGLADVSPLALQVYWSLYTGVLAFWANDNSPKQEDTLALLDQSINMFVAWLRNTADASD